MESIKQAGAWFLLAGFLFCFAQWIGNWSENTDLRGQIERKNELLETKEARIAQLHAEHAKAMSAIGDALALHKEIQAYEKERFCEAERVLGNNPAFCNQRVPDDVRLFWQDDTTTGSPDSSGNASQ